MENYEEFISNIIATRGRFSCGEEYHERHHITPRCLGGTDDESNLVDLFAKEHFIAHKLLAKENPDKNSLVYAWSCMAFVKGNNQERYELTAEEYAEARKAISEVMHNRIITDEARENMRKASQAKVKNPEYIQKQKASHKGLQAGEKNPMFGKTHTEATRIKIGLATVERAQNEAWRKSIGDANRGENNARRHPVYCPELNECFWGAKEVEDKYNILATSVLRCCRGKRKHAGKHPSTGVPLSWISMKNNNNTNT
jgi:hypothetical protein